MTGFIQGSSLYTDIFKSKGKGEAPEDRLVLVTLCEVSKAKRSPFAGGSIICLLLTVCVKLLLNPGDSEKTRWHSELLQEVGALQNWIWERCWRVLAG